MSRKTPENDARLIEHLRHRLDEDVAGLDSTTVSRLRRARQRALAHANAGKRPWQWIGRLTYRPAGDWLLPAGAFASVLVTALALTLMVAESDDGTGRAADDIELLTASEELELYENLEFYQWLGNREQAG